MGTYTTNYQLYMPTVGETGWGTLINGNYQTIDTTMKGLSNRITTCESYGARITAIENEVNGNLSCTSVTTSGKITGNGGIAGTTGTFSGNVTAASFNNTVLGNTLVISTTEQCFSQESNIVSAKQALKIAGTSGSSKVVNAGTYYISFNQPYGMGATYRITDIITSANVTYRIDAYGTTGSSITADTTVKITSPISKTFTMSKSASNTYVNLTKDEFLTLMKKPVVCTISNTRGFTFHLEFVNNTSGVLYYGVV